MIHSKNFLSNSRTNPSFSISKNFNPTWQTLIHQTTFPSVICYLTQFHFQQKQPSCINMDSCGYLTNNKNNSITDRERINGWRWRHKRQSCVCGNEKKCRSHLKEILNHVNSPEYDKMCTTIWVQKNSILGRKISNIIEYYCNDDNNKFMIRAHHFTMNQLQSSNKGPIHNDILPDIRYFHSSSGEYSCINTNT